MARANASFAQIERGLMGARARQTLGSYSLDNLLRGAARLDPHGRALHGPVWRDGADRMTQFTFRALDETIDAVARRLICLGLLPGTRILFVGGANPASLITLIAALRAGASLVLAPAGHRHEDLAAIAAMSEASAIIGAGYYPGLAFAERLFETAALARSVRLVATFGMPATDGAVTLDEAFPDEAATPLPERHGELITLAAKPDGVALVAHAHSTLAAAALDFIGRLAPDGATVFYSTLAPLSLAGLVAGPLAAILSGSPLHLGGGFSAAAFLRDIDAARPVHLIAPARLGPMLSLAKMIEAKSLSSLTLLTRHDSGAACASAALAQDFAAQGLSPVFDLHSIAECACLARRRGRDGPVHPIAGTAHTIDVDGETVLACEARLNACGGLDMRGAAVENAWDWRAL